MIARDSNWPFGGRITVIHTPSFECKVSTNKEGVFEPLSLMLFEGDKYSRPAGKIIYSSALQKSDIQKLHTVIVQAIDAGGENGVSLGATFEGIINSLKEKGLVSEAINLASW